MEQACSQEVALSEAPPQPAITGISLQQSRQVLLVLQEAFAALIYHLQQVGGNCRHGGVNLDFFLANTWVNWSGGLLHERCRKC